MGRYSAPARDRLDGLAQTLAVHELESLRRQLRHSEEREAVLAQEMACKESMLGLKDRQLRLKEEALQNGYKRLQERDGELQAGRKLLLEAEARLRGAEREKEDERDQTRGELRRLRDKVEYEVQEKGFQIRVRYGCVPLHEGGDGGREGVKVSEYACVCACVRM